MTKTKKKRKSNKLPEFFVQVKRVKSYPGSVEIFLTLDKQYPHIVHAAYICRQANKVLGMAPGIYRVKFTKALVKDFKNQDKRLQNEAN